MNNVWTLEDLKAVSVKMAEFFGGTPSEPSQTGESDDFFVISIDTRVGAILIDNGGICIETENLTTNEKTMIKGYLRQFGGASWVNGDSFDVELSK